ncbi:MAG: DUF554 family protein, partial [Chloroflexota bacterium]
PVLLIEGAYTLAAQQITSLLSPPMIAEISGAAGIILIGLRIRILELKPLRTANMLPALALVPFISAVLG